MPRKRQIDPGFWASEHAAQVCREARLLFLGMISNADDEGRIKASPAFLRVTVFPYDTDVTDDMVLGWRDELAAARDSVTGAALVQLYGGSGGELAWITGFGKHQYVNKRYPSKLPAPPPLTRDSATGATPLRHHSATGSGMFGVGIDVDSGIDTDVDVEGGDPHAVAQALIEEKATARRWIETMPKAKATAVMTVLALAVRSAGEGLARRVVSELCAELPTGKDIRQPASYLHSIVQRLTRPDL